ncbi:uncharacterized protein LOC110847881 isoform X2 [Folsomia candida]|uniref:uncharacterized protein LOC110847881 isoform X2 n=1 Tax=Folsomia candida TaxID=158441 RepID=UPI000B8F0830|nr:uncharacterized protein LOC110847881 isoform X2 [Folsomia candida]
MSNKTSDEAAMTPSEIEKEKDNITDDDGIENFLSEAIGQDVDVDVFKDIGDSDTIAELMEVVTASFVGTNSRRNSNQEEKILPEIPKEVSRSLVSPRPIRRPGKKFPALQPEEKRTTNKTKNNPPGKKRMSEKEGPGTSDKIKNRLKVRLKFSPHQQHNIDVSPKNKTIKNSNTTKPITTSKHESVPKTTQDKNNISSLNVILKKRQSNENILLHKKCTNNKSRRMVGSKPCCIIVYDILKTDKFFEMVTPSTQQKSSSTSINLCSITEDKIEEFHAIEAKKRLYYHDLFNPSTNTTTVLCKVGEKKKYVVLVEPQKINLKETCDKKNYNAHKSGKETADKIKTPSTKKTSVDVVTRDNPVINSKSREMRKDIVTTPNAQHEECKGKINAIIKTCELEIKQFSVSALQNEPCNTNDEGLVKTQPLVDAITPSSSKIIKDEASITKSKTKDVKHDDEEKGKPLITPSPNSSKETLTVGNNSTSTTNIASTDVDVKKQKINMLKQQTSTPDTYVDDADDQQRRRRRQREKDETKREKDKKFERLENERQRKSSDTKKSIVTDRETTTSKLLQTCYSPTKGLSMPQSFRIPKAQGDYPKIPKLQQISTLLPKLDENEIPKPKVDATKEEDKKQTSATTSAIIKFEPDQSAADEPKSQVDGGHDESSISVRSRIIDESESLLPKLQCISDENKKQASTTPVSTKPKHDEPSEKPKSQVDDSTNHQIKHEKQALAYSNYDKINTSQQSPNRQVQPEFNCPATPAMQNDADEAVDESHATMPDPDDAADDSSVPNDCGATLPPLSEIVEIGNFAKAVTVLIQKNFDISEPTFNNFTSTTDAITGKCAWWFSKCDKEPPNLEDIKLPRLDSVNSSYGSDAGSDASFLGNVSDSDRHDDNCQVHEISSTSHKLIRGSTSSTVDPDKVDEFCGRSLLQAKIRTSAGQNFRNIFDLRSGSSFSYDKENFQAKCNLCNQLIVGKLNLATHVRGATHKENLRKLDLHMEKSEKAEDNSVTQTSKTMSITKTEEKKTKESKSSPKKDSSNEKEIRLSNERVKVKIEPSGMKMQYGTTSTGLSVKIPVEDDVSIVKRSRSPLEVISRSKKSRSRSPRRRRTRSRSRSPVSRIPRSPTALRLSRRSPEHYSRSRRHSRRSRSRSRSRSPRSSRRRRTDSDEYRSRKKSPPRRSRRRSKSRSPPLPKKDNREFHAKLALTADGKWTDEMEKQWKLMEAEEAMFREQFIDRRKEYVSAPEEHPRYANEWTEFWERRYQEVEKEGKDPDTYNYVVEWKDFWSKRLNFLLQEEADEKIREIKRKYKMDFESLNLLRKTIHQSTPVPVNANKILENPERVYFERNKADQIMNGSASATVDPAIMIMLGSNSSKGNGSIIDISDEGMSAISSGNVILNEQNKVPEAAKRSISVEDFKSTWEAYTRPKPDGNYLRNPLGTNLTDGLRQGQDSVFIPEFSVKTPFSQPSIAPSDDTTTTSSDGSLDSLGFDLVQVLRLMCKTEDQLSFLAPKVLEYFKIAEELELKKSKGSHILLGNEELVTILFQARDRFMTMIRSNVLGRDILQKLNLTVYGLNSILEIPQCQKFRPAPVPVATSLSPETFTTPTILKTKTLSKPDSPAAVETVKSDSPKVPAMSAAGIEVATVAAHLSPRVKSFLAGEISKYLLLVGGQSMSGPELAEFVLKLISPLIKKTNKPMMENKADSSSSEKRPERKEQDPFDINISQNSQATILGHDYTHSFDMRITGVSGSKAVGSALPTLPNMFYRSANVESQEEPMIDVRNRRNATPATNNDQPPSKSQTREDDGRQSPFSRRELSMNPDRDVVRY